MEENNKLDPKFKDLSTKKKIFHYVGWPLLVLGCVGTIVFSALLLNASSGNASSSSSIIKYTFADTEITQSESMTYIEMTAKTTINNSINKNQIYEFTIPNSYFNDKEISYIDFAIGEENGGVDGTDTPTNVFDSQLLMGEENIIFTNPLDYVTIQSTATAGGKGNINVKNDNGYDTPLTLEMGTKDLSARCSCAKDINTPRVIYFSVFYLKDN